LLKKSHNLSGEVKDSTKASPGGGGLEGARSTIDINCDMGEGMDNDEAIMPFISSANIACGYHAGDEKTMWQTIELAIRYKVAIGAHVSLLDKKNFGRSEMATEPAELYDLVTQQLMVMDELIEPFGISLHHVKPHGALYNMVAKDRELALSVARAVKEYDEKLILFGLSGSYSISEANAIGLQTANEAFADRSYEDDGNLRVRSLPGALLEEETRAVQQVLQIMQEQTVTTYSGKTIPLAAQTICIHGDGKHAVDFAKAIYNNLKQNEIDIKAL
jgi:5-oxoprolinase (ATP-hydrolysing) subunit A